MKRLKRSQCSILSLVLKGKWYDMIASGEKREEYRDNTPYWHRRLSNWVANPGHLVIAFSRGYRKPDLFIEACGINVFPNRLQPEWGEPIGLHYVIFLKSRVELIDDKKVCEA